MSAAHEADGKQIRGRRIAGRFIFRSRDECRRSRDERAMAAHVPVRHSPRSASGIVDRRVAHAVAAASGCGTVALPSRSASREKRAAERLDTRSSGSAPTVRQPERGPNGHGR